MQHRCLSLLSSYTFIYISLSLNGTIRRNVVVSLRLSYILYIFFIHFFSSTFCCFLGNNFFIHLFIFFVALNTHLFPHGLQNSLVNELVEDAVGAGYCNKI